MIHQLSNGLWEINFNERVKGMEGAGAEMCTLDAQTICASFGGKEILVPTTPKRTRQLAEMMKARGIKPEWEVFRLEDIVQDVNRAISEGMDEPPFFVNIVLGVNGRRCWRLRAARRRSPGTTWIRWCRGEWRCRGRGRGPPA